MNCRSLAACCGWIAIAAAACGTPGDASSRPDNPETVASTESALSSPYDWLQFYGNAQHTGDNLSETSLSSQNVSGLAPLFQVTLPGTVDSAPAILTNVTTSTGSQDLAFVTTTDGRALALNAHTGALVWSQQPATSPGFTTSAPAVDPSRSFVYAYGLDGKVHKYAVGTGVETTTGGWPEVATAKPSVEKGSTSLAITTVGTTSYLHIGYSGYGDGGNYQGHLTTINLSTGTQNVFNSVCSNQTVHFVLPGAGTDCAFVQSAIWGRSGAVYDADTNKIYAATGNGTFDPTTFQWGDTLLALNPDGSGAAAGGPVDSYTPSSFQTLQTNDWDLGSASIAILPTTGAPYAGAKFPHVAVQAGKDSTLRLINLDNPSGQGGPGHSGGELFSVTVPGGNSGANGITIANGMPTWVDSGGTTWFFAATYGRSGVAAQLLAYSLVDPPTGSPSLTLRWQKTTTGTGGSLLVANNVLYSAIDHSLRALDPTGVNTVALWTSSNTLGTIHWQSPVVANGIVYIADNSKQLCA